MNIQRIPRRLAVPAASKHSLISSPFIHNLKLRPQYYRGISSSSKRQKKESPGTSSPNPLIEKWRAEEARAEDVKPRAPQQGNLPPDSIFDVEKREITKEKKEAKKEVRDKRVLNAALDPDPTGRRTWERKMVIREIRHRGRLTRAQVLKRTERESLSKSTDIKTSVKKLGALARQIAGKTVDEALVQMRFSKKKAAQSVRAYLEYARDTAVVKRGMGLGKIEGTQGEPVEIQLKDGKRHLVKDRTQMYIDQAWVGRGPYDSEIEYRARGKRNILKKPYTSISILLKEEATRVRLAEERKKKEDDRKPWLQLPDRNVSAQHQYPLW